MTDQNQNADVDDLARVDDEPADVDLLALVDDDAGATTDPAQIEALLKDTVPATSGGRVDLLPASFQLPPLVRFVPNVGLFETLERAVAVAEAIDVAGAPGLQKADAALGDMPVNFLADLDITGGNSGSAALNAKGEFIGLAFDGTLDSIIADWDYNKASSRSIQVDLRYMLWQMKHVDKADNLLKEMNAE